METIKSYVQEHKDRFINDQVHKAPKTKFIRFRVPNVWFLGFYFFITK